MAINYYNRNFRPQHFYHVFNRGAYKKNIFIDKNDYETYTSILSYYLRFPRSRNFSYSNKVKEFQLTKLENIETVHLVAYCLMPNHFHLLLKQLPKADKKTNISNLMRRVTMTYAKYFQRKYKHEGAILQGRYKNVPVYDGDQLLYLSKYIHKNPMKLVKKLTNYPYSSYQVYVGRIEVPEWLKPGYVIKLKKNYKRYVEQRIAEEEKEKFTKLDID